jgi:hypothetical protein
VRYEVTLEVEPGLMDAVEREPCERHIPAILATGCFRTIRLERDDKGRLRTTCEAADESDLRHYLSEHTERMRAEFVQRFPVGVRVSRETWSRVASWEAG